MPGRLEKLRQGKKLLATSRVCKCVAMNLVYTVDM